MRACDESPIWRTKINVSDRPEIGKCANARTSHDANDRTEEEEQQQ